MESGVTNVGRRRSNGVRLEEQPKFVSGCITSPRLSTAFPDDPSEQPAPNWPAVTRPGWSEMGGVGVEERDEGEGVGVLKEHPTERVHEEEHPHTLVAPLLQPRQVHQQTRPVSP